MTERLRIASGVFWSVESGGVLLVGGSGRGRLLPLLEAAAWDLICRGDSPARAAAKLALIGGLALAEAEAALAGWLRDWDGAGWIEGWAGNG